MIQVIKNTLGHEIFRVEAPSFKNAVEKANRRDVNLECADFADEDLEGVNLSSASLQSVDFRGAYLRDADFCHADVSHANFIGANLQDSTWYRANLSYADLRDVNARSVDFSKAHWAGALLEGADLMGAYLSDGGGADIMLANWMWVMRDVWQIYQAAPGEVEGVRQAILDGRIDGSVYVGDCRCLIGTIAELQGCPFNDLPGIIPDADRPAEIFFAHLHPGDTPSNKQEAKLALQWTDAFLATMKV